MIPRVIHYCWFGGNELSELARKCIESWEKFCPDYEIIRWDESNYDIAAAPLYVRQAYEAKKWAFVTDYVRLQVVYDRGGIYLDTDVELLKSLDTLLEHQAYFGFEGGRLINTGLGFGAEKTTPILKELMEDYRDIPFVLAEGKLDLTPCPERNTAVFLRHGLRQDDSRQTLPGGVLILPKVYLNPFSDYSGRFTKSEDTISVHWYGASWFDEDPSVRQKKRRAVRRKDALTAVWQLPNRVLLKLLGQTRYEKLKQWIKPGQ